MYLSIKGETFDGNTFFEKAFEMGAKACMINFVPNQEVLNKYIDKTIVKVENTIEAIQKLAKYKRLQYNIPVVAVTGSVGKTSTKDIIASVVSQKFHTLKAQGSYNNYIGLPLTILNLKDHTALVLEIGMNHFGEISKLVKIAMPTIAIINNVGTAHIGNLGSREGILKAKLEILEGLMPDGTLIINNDNDLLHNWANEYKENVQIKSFGIENKSDYIATNIKTYENGSEYKIKIQENTWTVEVPVGGNHFILNSLCAFCVGELLNIEEPQIIKGIKEFELTKMRMDVFKTKNDILIIDDTYNASYDSMKYAIEYLGKLNKRKIALLADMLELGEYSKYLHKKVGKEVVDNNIDILITLGEEAKSIAQKALELGMEKDKIFIYKTPEEVIEKLTNTLTIGDAILIKGSRKMKLEEILEKMKNTIFI